MPVLVRRAVTLAVPRPVRGVVERTRRLEAPITTPLLQLHGELDGCIQATSEVIDRERFVARIHEVVPNVGHFGRMSVLMR
jgi:pimeloyl-ACP methyl ester carboxylesterase